MDDDDRHARHVLVPTVEVRVYQFGLLRVCEWFTSRDEAMEVVDMWASQRGVRCEMEALSA